MLYKVNATEFIFLCGLLSLLVCCSGSILCDVVVEVIRLQRLEDLLLDDDVDEREQKV